MSLLITIYLPILCISKIGANFWLLATPNMFLLCTFDIIFILIINIVGTYSTILNTQ